MEDGPRLATPDTPPETELTLDAMRRDIAAAIDVSSSAVGDGDDLIAIGLDSIGVMRLAAMWKGRGADIGFGDLIELSTLEEWWRLVASRTAAPADGTLAYGTLAEVDESAPFDLATMQLAYWVGRQRDQPLGVGCHYYFEFDGHDLDAVRLETAARVVIQRHGMLRARVTDDGRQQILPQSAWRGVRLHDFRHWPPRDAARALDALRQTESHRRLDVEQGEGFDIQLSRLPDGATRVHVNIDMLVADALSFRILIDEIARLYADPATALPPLRYSYPRYLEAQTARRALARERARAYWQSRLAALPGPPHLPLAIEPERLVDFRTGRRAVWLGPDDAARLTERARRYGVTVPMVLAAIFAEVLGAWSTEPSFVLNVPLFDRDQPHEDVARIVGEFSSAVLLTVDVAGEEPFVERARRIQAQFRADAAHGAYSAVEVLRDLARARPDAPPARAGVVFTSAIGIGDLFGPHVPRQFGPLAWMMSQTAQVWLDHQVTELDGGLLINWDVMEPLFPDGTIDAMFAASQTFLRSVIDTDSAWEESPGDLRPASQRLAREAANQTDKPTSGRLLHEGFFAHAIAHPQEIAVAWGDASQITYGELADRARRIASVLVARGTTPDACVAITMAKGPRQIEAVFGILCAGAAYVPVDVEQPLARRAQIYAIAGTRIVLTTAAERDTTAWPEAVEIVAVDEVGDVPPLAAPVALPTSALAYVIFTSGSTGEPKGVMVPHSAAMNTIDDILDRFAITARDRVLSVSSLDFDWTVADIFEPLSVGGAVVLIEPRERRDAWRWADLVRRWQVTLWQSVPALLDMLLLAASAEDLASLRLVMLGGDWVGLDQFDRLRALAPTCRLVALGGITETSVHCTVFEVTAAAPPHWRSVPYGRPLSNVRCRVVDARGRDCPDWVPGELWVSGAGVARGYLGDPQRTARLFVEHDGQRWYRSGDLAKYWPDGTLEFLGRADTQVKIRGHRIELGEVEAAFIAHPAVARAIAVVIDAPMPQLAIAVVPRGAPPDRDDLLAVARERLPEYMLPERVAFLERLPLGVTDKIDRRAIARLLMEQPSRDAESGEPPRGEIERTVAAVWSELLGVADIRRGQTFFSLGGDSLLATRMVARLRAAGLRHASLHHLFSHPQLAEFAAGLDAGAAPAPPRELHANLAARYEPFPPTDVQRAYWLGRHADFALGGVGSQWYWEFDGRDVDVARLEEAWNQIVARHDMLRAVFDQDGWQRVLPVVPRVSFVVDDAEDDAAPALAALRASLEARVADPSVWPLFEIRAVRYGGNATRVGFSFDYIVLDALSIMTVFDELTTLYEHPAATLPPRSITFRDCLADPRTDTAALESARAHWRTRLPDLPPPPQLPTVKDPASVRGGRFTRRETRLARARWQTIVARAREHNLTPSTVLAAAFAEVLAAWSGRADMTLVFTLFDRDSERHPEIVRVVGDFTSLLLVTYQPPPSPTWLDAARAMQEAVWESLQHRAVSALDVQRDLARASGTAVAPMPVVFTSTLGVADALVQLAFPFGTYVGGLSQTPQVYLDNQVVAHEGGLLANWDGIDEIFPDALLDRMFDAYGRLLDWLSAPETDWQAPVPSLIPEAQVAVRARVNATQGRERPRTLHADFFARAIETPDREAVVGPDERLTYGALADRALRVAAWLIQHDIRPGDVVAVSLPKSAAQIAAVLGVLAAGGTYVPVGVDQPPARRQRIFDTCEPTLVLDDVSEAVRCAPWEAPVAVDVDALAYVIYTSGSTGEPRGVEITHRTAINTIDDINDRFDVTEDDRVLAISALDFDLSVYDIFGLLSRGGTVVLVNDADRRDAFRCLDVVRADRITIWNSVPALLDMLLMAAGDTPLDAGLRLAMVSGDWVGLDLRPRLAARAPACRLFALGGATEGSIWSNWFEVETVSPDWRSIPYGFPLRNQQFRVVDPRGRDCPDWVPGELWIGGAGVARGYRHLPVDTAESFVWSDGTRWYRTGDRGRYWPDGTLEFLGRLDLQIKRRGHRIELGEIEAALSRHPAIARAVAFASDADRHVLGAALVPHPGETIDRDDVIAFLSRHLPAYMVPERFVTVASLPLTSNGKVDRVALSRLAIADVSPERDDPLKGPVEEALAAIWADVLHVPHVGRSQTFFALGGDSLIATALITTLRARLGVAASLRDLFTHPTVAQLAAVLQAADRTLGTETAEEGLV